MLSQLGCMNIMVVYFKTDFDYSYITQKQSKDICLLIIITAVMLLIVAFTVSLMHKSVCKAINRTDACSGDSFQV